MTLGKELASLRLKRKKSLEEQSQLLGVSINTLYRWEHDLAYPRKRHLEDIAAHFNVSLEWITRGDTIAALVTSEERKMLDAFRRLTNNDRYKAMGYLDCMLGLGE